MIGEPTLFDALIYRPLTTSIEDNFRAFHADNSWVYTKLVEMTYELHNAGRSRIGIAMLFEVLRWQYYRSTVDANSRFKVNNNYKALYARKIMAEHEPLAEIFETRELRAP